MKIVVISILLVAMLSACAQRVHTRVPEVSLSFVDGDRQPVANLSIVSASSDHEFKTDSEGRVVLPGETEVIRSSVFVPGGTYPVYHRFLVNDERFRPMSCSCMILTSEPKCPGTEILVFPHRLFNKYIHGYVTGIFKEMKRVPPNNSKMTDTIKFGDRIECQIYE